MIPKTNKPRPKDFRPIAVANLDYKILMSFIKKKTEDHLKESGRGRVNQIGFCEGGRTEFNLFVLQYLVGRAMGRKERLFVIAIDFKKAFDSVDRIKLIDTMEEMKISASVVDLVARLYSEDRTELTLGDKKEEIRVNSGIKQGCPFSTTLFKIVTFMIIKELEEKGISYDVDGENISSLWFADDSMLFARTREDAENNLRVVEEVGEKYGLKINREKSKVLIYGNGEKYSELSGLEVVESIKYLGMDVGTDKDMFKEQKGKMRERGKKYENLTYSVISKSCNRLMMGKTYWKGVVIPSVMYGAGLMNSGVELEGKMQGIENGVYRRILGGRKCTVVETLRGEAGASSMERRFMESRLMLTRSIWNGKNDWMKSILRKTREDRGNKWNKGLNNCLGKIGYSFEDLVNKSTREIKHELENWDNMKWRGGLETKTSVGMYKRFKERVGGDKIYDNRRESEILFQTRTNCLRLNNRFRHIQGREGEVNCDLCGGGIENLEHFMLDCEELGRKREREIMEGGRSEDREEWMGNISWKADDMGRVKNMVGNMWQERAKLRRRMGLQR